MYKALAGIVLLFLPAFARAHEVYVLPKGVIARDLTMPSLQVFEIISAHTGLFFFWGFITIWAIFTILSISVSKSVERVVDPILARLKPYAPLVARVTLGLAIISSGYFGAMFGPELPFAESAESFGTSLLGSGMVVLGILVTVGLFTRAASLLLILLYCALWVHYGVYMLTYTNYLGEMILILILGNTNFALDRFIHHLYPRALHEFLTWFEKHAFLILRASFGISLIFASAYAKFFYAQLAIDTVTMYQLDQVFPFEPSFIVLGAFAIELLLGLFFLFGIEVRFASLFLLFWLSLSLLYFGESVWPHIVLAGTAIAIFMHGYDRYTVQWGLMRMRHKRALEPTL